MGYLGVQLLQGLEKFLWYGTGTPGVECNGVGGMQGLFRGQAGGWGFSGEKSTMGTDKGELRGDAAEGWGESFVEQKEANVRFVFSGRVRAACRVMDAPKIRREEVWEDHVGRGEPRDCGGSALGNLFLCHPSSRVHLGDELTCATPVGVLALSGSWVQGQEEHRDASRLLTCCCDCRGRERSSGCRYSSAGFY